jgi:tetratricopeptide (TPR) repeat protein
MPKYEPPQDLPARLLGDHEMIEACRQRDFSQVFRLVKMRAGIYPSLIARRCDMTPSRVAEVIAGQRVIKDINVIERVADGLRIPGRLLGLARREWEPSDGQHPVAPFSATVPTWMPTYVVEDDLVIASAEDDLNDPEFLLSLIEGQLPELYKGANFFGARHSVPSAVNHAHSIVRLLESANGSVRDALLRTGALVAEFLGWLYQDLGDYRTAAYWSDRSMEWAQEAADDHMQSYVLYRKSHQAASCGNGQKVVALARAAQRIPDLTPQITALAAQQEAQGYALMNNPRAALAKFDEAHELASAPPEARPDSRLDTSYCTPAYVEIQRANCWIDLGDPMRAARLFEDELATLPRVYRNDRGVYLARLARAYAKGNEPELAADAAARALAIVNQTGSGRTLTELDSVASLVEARQNVAAVATFTEQFTLVRDRLTP